MKQSDFNFHIDNIKYNWDINKRILFIESVILRIPIVPLYLEAMNNGNGKLSIIDGNQRIKTLYDFITLNTFQLNDLKVIPEINNKSFLDLDHLLKKQLTHTHNHIQCFILPPNNPKEVVINIKHRMH